MSPPNIIVKKLNIVKTRKKYLPIGTKKYIKIMLVKEKKDMIAVKYNSSLLSR
jgi:hypothetical protein